MIFIVYISYRMRKINQLTFFLLTFVLTKLAFTQPLEIISCDLQPAKRVVETTVTSSRTWIDYHYPKEVLVRLPIHIKKHYTGYNGLQFSPIRTLSKNGAPLVFQIKRSTYIDLEEKHKQPNFTHCHPNPERLIRYRSSIRVQEDKLVLYHYIASASVSPLINQFPLTKLIDQHLLHWTDQQKRALPECLELFYSSYTQETPAELDFILVDNLFWAKFAHETQRLDGGGVNENTVFYHDKPIEKGNDPYHWLTIITPMKNSTTLRVTLIKFDQSLLDKIFEMPISKKS
jgi:hypothetical protein